MTEAVPQIEVGRVEGLVDVHLLGLPLDVHRQASEHSDELRREFALLRVQQGDTSTPDVHARLLDLMDSLEARFAGFTESTQAELDEAIEEGREKIDLVFRVPPEVKQAVEQLGRLLDEADDFCRSGGALLTMETPPDALAYRRWYLDEFARQAEGAPPRPWPGA